ncbi:MAG: hypothetical protein H6713_00160 [Myxococcales bacterium]|nr:hypothetical protein [Myxococcales bacterium]MCB9748395.1 hypothetical protein [Myxococcales bacterium]
MADDDWKVLPHDAPAQLADNLWRVEGELEGMSLRRCMVVARLRSGALALHNAMALDDAGMRWLLGLGRPAVMIVPNGWHRIDAARYKARFPELRVVCPAGSRARVEQRVAVDDTYACGALAPGDDSVTLRHLAGVKDVEGVMTVRSHDGLTHVLNDAMFNLAHGKGLFMFIYGRLMGNAGGPKITSITRWLMIKERAAFRADLEALADVPGLRRVIVAHGAVIDEDAPGVLRRVAAAL